MEFYSHGKLLLTAEYAVLEGVKALAVPTKRGQLLRVEHSTDRTIKWQSFTVEGKLWIDCVFDFKFKCLSANTSPSGVIDQLVTILKTLNRLSPNYFAEGITITTELEFPRDWGLGSSSTLINNLAQWLDINPYQLLEETMGGSGYDIAAAQSDSALFYTRNNYEPTLAPVSFSPHFKDNLFFVHLKQKQNSRTAIAGFKSRKEISAETKDRLEEIGGLLLITEEQSSFNALLKEHEEITAAFLGQTTVQERLFPDFKGQLKSLGAWGGDFILASGDESAIDYFLQKGYPTIFRYSDFILG